MQKSFRALIQVPQGVELASFLPSKKNWSSKREKSFVNLSEQVCVCDCRHRWREGEDLPGQGRVPAVSPGDLHQRALREHCELVYSEDTLGPVIPPLLSNWEVIACHNSPSWERVCP